MSIARRIGDAARGLFKREVSLTTEEMRRYGYALADTWTSEPVTTETALKVSVYRSAILIISQTIAQCTCIAYARESDQSRRRAYEHWMYPLLHDVWNPDVKGSSGTAHTGFQTLAAHLATRGNGYILTVRNGMGVPLKMGLVHPDRVRKYAEDGTGRPLFEITPQGGGPKQTLTEEHVCHVMAFSLDGWMGRDPLADMREVVGFGLSTARHGAEVLKNAVVPIGIFESEVGTRGRQMKAFRRKLKKWASADRKGEPLILEPGLKFKQLQLTPENLQLLATREFSVLDIARAFRIPPHMLGIMDRAIKANIEQQSIDFVRYCMLPWFKTIEAALNSYFFGQDAGGKYYCEFLVEELMRGDTVSQNVALETELRNGALTPDEWRAMRNRPPVPDGKGNIHIVPANMTTLDKVGEVQATVGGEGGRQRSAAEHLVELMAQQALDESGDDDDEEDDDGTRTATRGNGNRRPGLGYGEGPDFSRRQ